MIGSIAIVKLIGLFLTISSIISGAYALVELFIKWDLYQAFLIVTPSMLGAIYPREPGFTWLKVESSKNTYESWKGAFVYLFLMSATLFFMLGFWVLLALRLFDIAHVSSIILIFWFVINVIVYFVSAVNQFAIDTKIQYQVKTIGTIQKHMLEDMNRLLKRVSYYFFIDWVKTPVIASGIFVINLLSIMVYWPIWVMNGTKFIKLGLIVIKL